MGLDLVSKLLTFVIIIIYGTVGCCLICWLKQKIYIYNFNRQRSIAKMTVEAVEQTFGQGDGPDKKVEAAEAVRKAFGYKLQDDQVDLLIEAAVFEMNSALKPQNPK